MAQSLLATDGYKFSMAEAGWPLRIETFYYWHRKGGAQVLPVDVAAFVHSLLPRPTDDDYRYLAEHSHEMGAGAQHRPIRSTPSSSAPKHRCSRPSSGGFDDPPLSRPPPDRPVGNNGSIG
jgi:nicotinate phosphoribosyltransferase